MHVHSVFTNNHRVKHPERKKKEQMRGKSKCPIIFWAKLRPAGKKNI